MEVHLWEVEMDLEEEVVLGEVEVVSREEEVVLRHFRMYLTLHFVCLIIA